MGFLIVSKVIAATNTKGTRVQVKSWKKTTYFNWDYTLSFELNHIKAIREHIARLSEESGIEYKIVGDVDGAPSYQFMGVTPDSSGSSVIIR
jgi:hypothetical protein